MSAQQEGRVPGPRGSVGEVTGAGQQGQRHSGRTLERARHVQRVSAAPSRTAVRLIVTDPGRPQRPSHLTLGLPVLQPVGYRPDRVTVARNRYSAELGQGQQGEGAGDAVSKAGVEVSVWVGLPVLLAQILLGRDPPARNT